MLSVITRERNHEIKKNVNGWKAPQRSFTANIPDEKSKARRGQVTCPRYLHQGQKKDEKDSSEQAEKGRDSLKIDLEFHPHPTSKNKRRNFFKGKKKKKRRFHSVRRVAISSTEPSFRGSA